MKVLTCVLGLCLLLFHGQGLVASAENVQSTKSALCDADTGDWDPYDINCDFDCNGTGWELDCECDDKSDACTDIECKIDRDGAPDDEDIYLSCSANLGEAPQCDFAPLDQAESLIDACVVDTVKTVLSEWFIGFE
ncbi:hypothetical protein M9434_002749 [Picochlorum sp. BPE23]|nr:hypothetical protein M9434_002749 [Picochlorum sp. BPE23]